jgi:tripartite-type tricarboxylate transporter receptor subunit TctC
MMNPDIFEREAVRSGLAALIPRQPHSFAYFGCPLVRSPPDGYTLLFVAANNAISASLYKKLSFDFIRDTEPVASIMQLPNMLVVSNAMPVKTVQELIDFCRANPGKVFYASAGYGTSPHLSAELFKAMTKTDMSHVPYRGSALAYPDVISNKD